MTALDEVRSASIPAPPADEADWIGLVQHDLPIDAVNRWVVLPGCGAVVTFTGTVRDHTGDRGGVTGLFYETYEEQVTATMARVVAEARRRWPVLGRIAILHRTGPLTISDAAVVVAVSTPHRGEAFDAARFCIDTVKATAPIWKRESWDGGEAWVACADAHPPDTGSHQDPVRTDRLEP